MGIILDKVESIELNFCVMRTSLLWHFLM